MCTTCGNSNCGDPDKCCAKVYRGPRGKDGLKGNKGDTGATGPAGPAGTFETQETTDQPSLNLAGVQPVTVVTGSDQILTAGTYIAMFEEDLLNNDDTSTGTYAFYVDAVQVGSARSYGAGAGGYFREIHKLVLNERLVLAAGGTLTVGVSQTAVAGDVTLKRFSLITIKTA